MIINPAELTFTGEEIRELSEAVFESSFNTPDANVFHTFVPGIKVKKNIAILGRIQGLTGKGSNECNPTADAITIPMSEKQWDPADVSTRITECWENLKETFFAYGLSCGIAKADLTKTDFWMFVKSRMEENLKEEVYRIAWFSDVDAATAGILTPGTDPAFFNKIDGFFKQLFTIVAADPARKTAGLDSRNGQLSFATQEFDATDTDNLIVTNTLQNMRYGSDYRLRGKEGLQYIVTQSVADQYERELISCQKPYTTERLENGVTVLKSGGIDVVGFQFWDRIIRTYENDGTVWTLPHRALLTVKSNTQLGTCDIASLSAVDSLYDPIKKENHMDTAYSIDVKIIENELVQLAY